MTGAAALADRLARLSPAERRVLLRGGGADPGSAAPETAIPRRPGGGDNLAPLSNAQRRLWFLDRMSPGHFAYNSPLPLRLSGPVNPKALEGALRSLIDRHGSLRTSFVDVDGVPMQRVQAGIAFTLARADLSNLSADDRAAALQRRVAEHARQPFDLLAGPLIAAELVHLGPDDHALLVNLHHIVTDGWSVGVFLHDLDALWRGERLGALPLQYADFAHWEAEGGSRDEAAALAWWRERLESLPQTELPVDRPRPAQPSFSGRAVALSIAPMTTRLVEAMARRLQVSSFAVFLAAFFALMHRYTGQPDLAVGSVNANRPRRELEPLIGFFVNTLVMRQRLDPAQSFETLVVSVAEGVTEALEHGHVTFDRLVEQLNPVRDPSRNPLVQVALAVQTAIPMQVDLGPTRAQLLSADYHATRFDAEMHLFPDGNGGWHGALTYADALFDAVSMERFAARFCRLLADGSARPGKAIGALQLDDAGEMARWSALGNGPAPAPYRSLPQRFAAQARRTPHAPALIAGDTILGYRSLAETVDRLAEIAAAHSDDGAIVGVLAPPSVDMVAWVLALWRSGRAFLPLAPDLPSARLQALLARTKPAFVVGPTEALVGIGDLPRLHLDGRPLDGNPQPAAAVRTASMALPGPEALAYVIHTSGTSGEPKGVMLEHRGLANLADAQADEFGCGAGDRILQFASPSFDAFVFELTMALSRGAALVLPEETDRAGRLDVAGRVRRSAATHLTAPPSLLLAIDPAAVPTLRTVVAAGEAFPAGLDGWAARVALFNAYGPTEATVWSMIARVRPAEAATIGRPVRGHRVRIVNAAGRPVGCGIDGEIAIGGVGVARGYLAQPDLTAARFRRLTDDAPDERSYLTGDVGRLLPDGRLVFLGRRDRQIKLRGHRIEPAEIEQALGRHPAVLEAAVSSSGQTLSAHVCLRDGHGCDVEALRRHSAEHLPGYMVPDRFAIVATMPRDRSGKLDRKALPPAASAPVASDAEGRVTALFRQILDCDDIGSHDDFFALGGHSLLLLRLHSALEAEFDRRVPLAAIFADPTAFAIARRFEEPAGDGLSALIVPFRRGGPTTPLFLVHPAIGTALCYRALAQALPGDWPVYGIDAAPDGGRDLVAIAARYVAAIRGVRPAGPYRLGGWSLGGTIAFEMARQLRVAGERTELVMIDAGLPESAGRSVGLFGALAGVTLALARSVPRSRADLADLAALAGAPGNRSLAAVDGIARALLSRWRCFGNLSRAWLAYRPERMPGSVALIRARADGRADGADPILASIEARVTGDVARTTLAAEHMRLLGERNVGRLAAAIVESFRKLEEDS